MKTILLIHGPNLNRLGSRDQTHYGSITLSGIEELVNARASQLGYVVRCFQSNHEGALIDWIQEQSVNACGIIINPGALTHYSYALHDALLDSGLSAVEVHLSAITEREEWRRVSVTASACIRMIEGKRAQGYEEAVDILHHRMTAI